MLTEAIARSAAEGLEELRFAGARVVELVEASVAGWCAPAAVLEAPIEALQNGSRLLEECFGAVAVVVEYSDVAELTAAVDRLQGSSPPVSSRLMNTTLMLRPAWRCCRRRWAGCAPTTGRPVSHTAGHSNMAVRGRRPRPHRPRRLVLPPWTGSYGR